MRKLLLASAATMGALLATAGGALAQPVKAPAPGTVVVHLNGAFSFQFAGVQAANTATTKYGTLNTVGYLRLYPGFDATSEGGLQYGVASEIRDTTGLPNGAGVNGTASSTNGTVSLYVRRAYGYVGTKDDGYLRFGQGDGAFTLLSDGDLEGFGDAQQWNSDLGLGAIVPAGSPNNLFAATGKLYTTSKIVYLTPSFAGLNAAVSFEPNSNGLAEGVSGLSSETDIAGGSSNRRRNTVDAMLGYTVDLGAAKVKASGGEFISSPLGNTSGEEAYKDMDITQVGAQVAFAGLALGVNFKTGSVNDGYTFVKAGQRKDDDFLVSGTYTMGPYIIGASYFMNQSAGAYTAGSKTVARTETNDGIAVGADYNATKNVTLFTQYLYGSIHQPGEVFKNSAGDTYSKNNVHTNAISVGATLKW